MERIHLKGLNGLRAIAAMAVVISHINLNLNRFGLPKLPALHLANFSVTVFFSLSGFLITYLLLHEHKKTQTIDIKKFYVRRALRIWPVYFLYILLVIAYVGTSAIDPALFYYVFFAPNVAFVLHYTLPFLHHYWSLGVEEQFYLFWPLLVKYVNRLLTFLIVFICFFLLLKIGVKYSNLNTLYAFLHYSRFGCMAIGAIGAWLYFFKPARITFLNHRLLQLICWTCMGLLAINKFHLYSIIDHELIAFVTVILIYNQITSSSVINLQNRILDYLGKISFGIYVFNPLVIGFFEHVFNVFGQIEQAWLKYGIIYSTIPIFVVFVSHLSYHYFERKFLQLKNHYVVIPSSG
jgi:peptidoglycan/LPS O-acetylase OafA/YrhL